MCVLYVPRLRMMISGTSFQGNDVRGMGVAGRMYYYYYFYRYGMILYSKKVVIVSGRGISRS
jgi:hypothetical protein